MTKISVVITTKDRPIDLVETVTSLTWQTFQPDEIVIVDINSRINVRLFLTKYFEKLLKNLTPNLKIIRVSECSIGYARNVGLLASTGDIILFIDDDALAHERWVEEMTRTLQYCDIVGGLVLPLYTVTTIPKWFVEKLHGSLLGVCNFHGDIWNVNMGLRRHALRVLRGYLDLGKVKGSLVGGEDSELVNRARKHGLQVCFNPRAIVWHKVTARKLTLSYLTKRAFAQGVIHRLLDYLHGYGREHLKKLVVYRLLQLIADCIKLLTCRGTAQKISVLFHLALVLGYTVSDSKKYIPCKYMST